MSSLEACVLKVKVAVSMRHPGCAVVQVLDTAELTLEVISEPLSEQIVDYEVSGRVENDENVANRQGEIERMGAAVLGQGHDVPVDAGYLVRGVADEQLDYDDDHDDGDVVLAPAAVDQGIALHQPLGSLQVPDDGNVEADEQ